MFPFTTGSPWAVYSSWLMWVSSSRNRASFNYHSSPKAKLVLLFGHSKIRLSTFDLVPICIFTFQMFPLTSEYILIIWAMVSMLKFVFQEHNIPCLKVSSICWPFMWLLQGHKKLFSPLVPKFVWNMLHPSPALTTVNICSFKFTRRHGYFTLHRQQIWWAD